MRSLCANWASAVDGIQHTEEVQKATLTVLFGMIISKSWKIRYCLATLAIGSLPRQGLIMNYMTLSAPWVVIIIECMSLSLSCVDRTIRYNTQHRP